MFDEKKKGRGGVWDVRMNSKLEVVRRVRSGV